MTTARFRVARPGVYQRLVNETGEGAGFRTYAVGDTITVSHFAAVSLLAEGFIVPVDQPLHEVIDQVIDLADAQARVAAPPIDRCPDHPRYRGKSDPPEDCIHCVRVFEATQAREAK